MSYSRDLRGYGPTPPDAKWPGGARIAVQFVLNYEEGGENCLLHGDAASEEFLSDIPGAAPWPGQRHWNMESIYEYGARAGFWRLHRLFTGAGIPVTIYGVASALARSPEQVEAMLDAGWEIASHGLKWIEHKDMSEAEERAAITEAIRLHAEVVGERPRGWYTGRCSMNTVRLVAEEGGFAYISDSYDDDLPHWVRVGAREQLIIPYTLEANDMRFAGAPGYVTGEQFFQYLKDSFDVLYAEGQAGAAKMLSIGLHCRLIGRPGKLAGLQRFIAYIQGFEGVWCPRRIDIAEHWQRVHPPVRGLQVSGLSDAEFMARFAQVFGGVDWVVERAVLLERGPAHDCAAGLHSLLCRVFRRASPEEQRGVAESFAALGHDLDTTRAPDDLRCAVEAIARQRLSALLNGATQSERSQS
ncbi:allantoinase PuuE [Roseovarius sp.]|jgi:putative urate catabolism protein